MSDLKKQLIRLGSTNPELREHIRPVLASLTEKQASRKFRDEFEARKFIQGVGDAVSKIVKGWRQQAKEIEKKADRIERAWKRKDLDVLYKTKAFEFAELSDLKDALDMLDM